MTPSGLHVQCRDEPGVLHRLTGEIAAQAANVVTVETGAVHQGVANLYFELDGPDIHAVAQRLRELPYVVACSEPRPMESIFGARLIVIGGGAQVAAVASGAVQEADRHNIRGEHISIDTIPLVGEQTLASAVRAVRRLARVRALVLAGSLMGGDIETAVREVRSEGLIVISLNMAGSVPDACDLVVSDPVQAGVMAVMAVANTAKFTLDRLHRRVF